MSAATFVLRRRIPEPGETVRSILDELPEWFGRPESNQEYIAAARTLDCHAALDSDGSVIGVVLIEQHFPESAEVHLMAVRRAWHRHGVGRALLNAVESELVARGTSMLTVKTLGPSDPDEHYARTRRFYSACGFVPLEEFDDLWPGTACLLMAKSLTTVARSSIVLTCDDVVPGQERVQVEGGAVYRLGRVGREGV